ARGREAARWVLEELWVEPDGYFGYHPERPVNIHNANLLGAWLVHAALGDDPLARERVARALDRTLGHQNADGSWPYGQRAGLRDGHAIYRRFRRYRTTVKYMRWCDAHVALGMVDAAGALAGRDDPAPAAGVVADAP